jgi:hypothetical protein
MCQYNLYCGDGCMGDISLTLIHPVTQDIMRLLGFIIAAQWYCPPADGYALRNSARLAARHRLQTPAVINPQSTEVGPPLDNDKDNEVASAVHEFRMANAKPSIASGEKVRFNSWVCPRAASCRASSEMPPPVMIDSGIGYSCIPPALSSAATWESREASRMKRHGCPEHRTEGVKDSLRDKSAYLTPQDDQR